MSDTIYARASGPGRAGVAIIRISGPGAFSGARRLGATDVGPRQASLRRLIDPESGEVLDEGIVITFPGPASYTGEDVVELQVHGSPAVVRGVQEALGRMPGLREAEPGEFTRRAMINGRLDLAQVEGLGDLLAAETATQRRLAMVTLSGDLSRRVSTWKDSLITVLAFVEVGIDFADEELPDDVTDRARRTLEMVRGEMAGELVGGRIAERIRHGFEVAIVGRPNVGKSTLLNRIAGREAALTSPVEGTTRDVIEVRMDLDGLSVTVLDMAGLRASEDTIESLGVSRARERADAADLRIFLLDDPADMAGMDVARLPGDVVAIGKADIRAGDSQGLVVSGVTGAGIDELLSQVSGALSQRSAGGGALAHRRQREAVARAEASLGVAHERLAGGDSELDLAAEEIRAAIRALDFLLGQVDVEAVLDVVFRNFCLGK